MVNNDFKLIDTGYLYSPWNGTLREFAGEVYHRDEYRTEFGRLIVPEHTHFIVKDGRGRTIKKFDCAANEGYIHNKNVWLREPDKRQAADILIEYEETQISKLRLQIENHESLVEILKDIVNEE